MVVYIGRVAYFSVVYHSYCWYVVTGTKKKVFSEYMSITNTGYILKRRLVKPFLYQGDDMMEL